jgi:hypothetical protein
LYFCSALDEKASLTDTRADRHLEHQHQVQLRSGLPSLGFSLASALWPRRAALDGSSLWTLDVVSRDPLLVVCLGPSCHGWALCASNRHALVRSTLLGSAAFRAIATFALPRKVGRNPNSVEKVDDTDEAGEEEEIKEDASERQREFLCVCESSRLTFGGRKCSCLVRRC